MPAISRREFVKLGTMGGAGLMLGLSPPADARAAANAVELLPLVRIGPDGQVILFAQNPDMGQGVKTALPLIIAEELDVNWATISVRQSPWDTRLRNQFSGGSLSVRLNYAAMRQAGASAREMLKQAAALRWQVPVGELSTSDATVRHATSGRVLTYGDLAEAAATLPVPEEPQLKAPVDFRLIGRDAKDVDIVAMLEGGLQYGFDVSLPGMLHAVVRRSPWSDGQPKSFDAGETMNVAGVVRCEVLRNDEHGGRIVMPNSPNFVSGVAVLAESTWAAMQGARKLQVDWERPATMPDSAALMRRFHAGLATGGEIIRADGDVDAALDGRPDSVDATYELPFLAHVPMEPMNCTVDASGDRVIAWAPTQNPSMLAETLAAVIGVDPDVIDVNVLRSGGAFGRRYYADFAVDAALLSRRVGRPVKVVWPREDDVRHGYFRPASVQRVRAAADDTGRITAWHHKVISHPRRSWLGREGLNEEIGDYEFPAGFIPNLRYEYLPVQDRIPLGQWRAIEHSSNVFVTASVIDELARSLGADPVRFLLRLVGDVQFVQVRDDFRFDAGRLAHVISEAAKLGDWGRSLPDGRGRGIAASYNQGAWVAQVAEVTLRKRRLSVDRVVSVIDCGLVINPQGAENQVQGGIIDGLSAALMGEITVAGGIVEQRNFDDYPVCRMAQVPEIIVQFVPSADVPRGIGEASLPPVAAAVANAIFDACGERVRSLPLRRHFDV